MTKSQPFTPAQLRELRSEMDRELAWLLRSLTRKQTVRGGTSSADASTQRSSEQDEMQRELRERAQMRLAAILAAIARLENGTYGECAACRKPISYGRLMVMPEATMCIACGGTGRSGRHAAALGNGLPGGAV